ncbi:MULTISPECIES: hypothetical protein [Dactylosporangium]|uniref:ABC transporter substrate-binding protein n=2 Tax=Dactylosporangium TaxID=35753 RepID=A0A9W6NJB9_9ACTN|nr:MULTISPECIES: hypothetical protein [Dactylosporangium]UAB98807.1 hypothetical protein Dvina_12445 [Dactylosporangium vinaceum]UWZ47058.1 hypothetical protein Dmats_12030 [Dactylosporangium matsuzakiense]GLK98511.1 hypothetical protein GCM10017581_002520 [Dactylosporangium matsuzakiense]
MENPKFRTALGAMAMVIAMVALSLVGGTAANAAPAKAAAPDAVGTLTSVVTGTFTDAQGGTGTFAGTFTPSQFTPAADHVDATGVLAGQLTDSTGAVQNVSQTQTFAVQDINPIGCQVLDLNLAPLDLNLLGLAVHLDRVHLNITAIPGAGNLLGNLICGIAGLLDGVGLFAQISQLLNQILGLLGLLGGL